jgi:hypothetical protein
VVDPVFRQWNDFLAPNPDAQYGSVLPFAYNREGSPSWVTEGNNPRWALPEWLRSAAQGVVGLGESTQTGSLTPEALALLTSGSVGTGALMAPRGALASGAARPGQTEWQIFRQPGTNPHNALEVHIAKNPTRDEVARLAGESQHGEVRMVRDAAGNNYAWQAELGTHEGIADAIGLTLPDRLNPDSIKRTFQGKGGRVTNPKGQTEGWFRDNALAGGPGIPGFNVAPPQQPQQAPPPGFRVAKDMVY